MSREVIDCIVVNSFWSASTYHEASSNRYRPQTLGQSNTWSSNCLPVFFFGLYNLSLMKLVVVLGTLSLSVLCRPMDMDRQVHIVICHMHPLKTMYPRYIFKSDNVIMEVAQGVHFVPSLPREVCV